MQNPLSKTIVKQIIELYTVSQLTATDIAKEIDVALASVLKHLRLNNIPIRGAFKTSKPKPSREIPLDTEQLIRWYTVEHIPSTEIAKRFNVKSPTILRRLKSLGIQINPKHGNPYNKIRIKTDELPKTITNLRISKTTASGEVICPICFKTRRVYLNRKRIQEIEANNGRCSKCASLSRAYPIDLNEVRNMYHIEHLSAKEIANKFHMGVRRLYEIMRLNNIPRRNKSETKSLLFKKNHKPKGTLGNPILGDIRNGAEIGLNNHSYYQWVQCEKCGDKRWELKSRVKKYPICKPCAMILNGERHSGENAPAWLGGISFEPYSPTFNNALKRRIRERDEHTCQLCGQPQNGKMLAVHHINYDKQNNDETNLISLCPPPSNCHNKTTHHREYWQQYFTELIKLKYATLDNKKARYFTGYLASDALSSWMLFDYDSFFFLSIANFEFPRQI